MAIIITSRKKFDSAVAHQATEACDQIMNEMGAEIHDDLIQKLSIFGFYLDRIQGSGQMSAEMEELVINMRTDFENVSHAVRRVSRRLLQVKMEYDSFKTSVEVLCQNMESSKSGNIHFEHMGIEQNIPALSQSHLYRIIQELIHNAFKHSSAWHIWVRLRWESTTVIVEVEDDGVDVYNTPNFMDRLRMKYNTLRMRTQVLGGSITYRQGDKGLLAKVELPIL